MSRWTVRDAVCLLVLLAVGLALWAPRLHGPIDLRYDAGVYYLLGTSIAEGHGFRLLNEPGHPEGIQYPPVLPLIVAVHQWALGTSDFLIVGQALRVTYFLMTLGLIGVLYALARRYVAAGYATFAVLVSLLYYNTYFLSDLLFTELPFALITTGFLLCWLRGQDAAADRPGREAASATDGAGGWRWGWGWTLACGVLGATAFLLRSAGVAVLAAWVGDALLRRQWRQVAARGLLALLPFVAWQMHVSRVTASEDFVRPAYEYQRASYQFYNVSYIENIKLIDPFEPDRGRADAGDWTLRVLTNLSAMPSGLGQAVSVPEGFWTWFVDTGLKRVGITLDPKDLSRGLLPPLLGLGGLVLLGTGLLAWRREWLVPLYVAASVGLICLTPWPGQFARYLTPLTPVLAICLAVALAWIGSRWGAKHRWPLALTITVAVSAFAAQGFALARSYGPRLSLVAFTDADGQPVRARHFYYDRHWAEYDVAVDWIREHARPGEVVATSSPHWLHIRTGQPAVMPPFIIDPAEAQRLMDTVPVTYLIVDGLYFVNTSWRYARPTVDAFPDLWEAVYSSHSGELTIYRRTKVPADPDAAGAPTMRR